jgi:hypothetical protein
MKTRRKILLLAVYFTSILSMFPQAYGEIRGVIQNPALEPVPFATVKILQGSVLVGGAQTDERGKYSCKPLNPGTYELVVLHPEYKTQMVNKITVNPSGAAYVDVKLEDNTLGIVTVTAKEYDYTHTGVDVNVFHQISMGALELRQNSSNVTGDIKNALAFMSSEVVVGTGGELHVRGARSGATGFFVDGVRLLEPSSVPGLAIENISAFTGGIPAMYGDLSSGAVMVTTKTYFSGLRDKNIRTAAARVSAEEE